MQRTVTPAPDASSGRSREDNMRILSAVFIIIGVSETNRPWPS
jgi:hypothetical protein